MKLHFIAASALLAIGGASALAAPVDAERIGKTLTAAGSSVEANGPIPKYEGREVLERGWSFGKNRQTSWKYHAEKPQYTIDASNLAKYAELLTPGQLALFKAIPDYKMDVYPTHRSCAFPDFVMENTKRNVKEAKLREDGNGLATGVLPGVPFPGTQSGLEAIWNHLLHYQGLGMDVTGAHTLISPRGDNDAWIDLVGSFTMYYPLSRKGTLAPTEAGGTFLATYIKFTSPAALAGQATVMRSVFASQQEVSYYFPGQRRVRRMPTFAYDAPIIGYENQLMIDSSFAFNGNPDRFDWKIVGEKNVIVPYNSFALYDTDVKLEEVTGRKSVGQKVRRYELHRVVVVEASLKAGVRHTSPKRTFYLDQDSYIALLAEDHDAQNAMWRVRESFPMPVHELGGACAALVYSQYDLQSGRYLIDTVTAGQPASKAMRFYIESEEPRFKSDFYTQDNLRAMSER